MVRVQFGKPVLASALGGLAALMISTSVFAQEESGAAVDPAVVTEDGGQGIAVGEPSPYDGDDAPDAGDGGEDWVDDGDDADWVDDGSDDAGDGGDDDGLVGICGWADGTEPAGPCNGWDDGDVGDGGDDGLVGVCGWADGTEPSGPCNDPGDGDGEGADAGGGDDGLVGVCGWAAGAEPSGPCNTGWEVWLGGEEVLYMTSGPIADTGGAGPALASGGGSLQTRFQPQGQAVSSFGQGGLAACLAIYPDLPWICEWQDGADQ